MSYFVLSTQVGPVSGSWFSILKLEFCSASARRMLCILEIHSLEAEQLPRRGLQRSPAYHSLITSKLNVPHGVGAGLPWRSQCSMCRFKPTGGN